MNYARYLEWLKSCHAIVDWHYEPVTLYFDGITRGVTNYTPDFFVSTDGVLDYKSGYFVEVKGYMDAKSKTKIKRMSKYFPSLILKVIEKNWFVKNRSFANTIFGWER